MYLTKTPSLIKPLFKDLVWNIPNKEKKLYLTFDDGPKPTITPWVLQTLKDFKARATFFCVGSNVAKHPEIVQEILDEGHKVGNHTHNHLNGWDTPDKVYFSNVEKCTQVLNEQTRLFRPPYGQITKSQISNLKSHYSIIMWDVLSGDFDKTLSKEKCLDNVLKHTKSGSVIVFHDSMKAAERMKYALPLMLEQFTDEGYTFEVIPEKD